MHLVPSSSRGEGDVNSMDSIPRRLMRGESIQDNKLSAYAHAFAYSQSPLHVR